MNTIRDIIRQWLGIEPIPGPPGPQGPAGLTGECSCNALGFATGFEDRFNLVNDDLLDFRTRIAALEGARIVPTPSTKPRKGK